MQEKKEGLLEGHKSFIRENSKEKSEIIKEKPIVKDEKVEETEMDFDEEEER